MKNLAVAFILLITCTGIQGVAQESGINDSTFNPIDTGFGGVYGASGFVYAIAEQNDGKIVVTGTSWSDDESKWDIATARLNPNGTLDTSFGHNGTILTDLGQNSDGARSVHIQQDGKILISGYSSFRKTGYDAATLLRYKSDGSLDPSFGSKGVVKVDVSICK